jgi:hypothetical protein
MIKLGHRRRKESSLELGLVTGNCCSVPLCKYGPSRPGAASGPASVRSGDLGDHAGGDLAVRLALANRRRQASPAEAGLVPVDTDIGPSAARILDHDKDHGSIPWPDDPDSKWMRGGGGGHAAIFGARWLMVGYRDRLPPLPPAMAATSSLPRRRGRTGTPSSSGNDRVIADGAADASARHAVADQAGGRLPAHVHWPDSLDVERRSVLVQPAMDAEATRGLCHGKFEEAQVGHF